MRQWYILLVALGCVGAGISFYVYQQTGDHMAYGDPFWGLEETRYSVLDESAKYVAVAMQRGAIAAEPYRNYSLIGAIVGGSAIVMGFVMALLDREKAE